MQKLIIVGGPTASGKTDLAIKLAREHNGELINADSRQIYKYLSIGTNVGEVQKLPDIDKIENFEFPIHTIDGIKIYLLQFLNPDVQFNLFDYKKLAESYIQKISESGKTPILVGGTGLYIDAILKNYLPTENDSDENLRKELENLEVSELQSRLQTINPTAFENLNQSDQKNPRRLIRLIEKSFAKPKTIPSASGFDIKNYEITFYYPKFEWVSLKTKIENRVDKMFEDGIVEETQKVLDMGFPKSSIALQGIGYREVLDYLHNKINREKCIELVKIAHKQYAKRQRTWFEGKSRGYELVIN